MYDESEIIKFIEDCISARMSTETIGDLKWNFAHYVSVPNNKKYDHLTINQYITYYKINKLEELGLISSDIKDTLISKYTEYLEICKKIGKEAYREMTEEYYKSDCMEELYLTLNTLKEELLEYNLDDSSFNLNQMILKIVVH